MVNPKDVYSVYMLAYARQAAEPYGDFRLTLASALGCIHARTSSMLTTSELAAKMREMGAEQSDDGSGDDCDVGPSARDRRIEAEAHERLSKLILAGGHVETGGRSLYESAADEIARLRGEVEKLTAHIGVLDKEQAHDEKIDGRRRAELRQVKEALEVAETKVRALTDMNARLDREALALAADAQHGREQGAAEMRERAAAYLSWRGCWALAECIRALPLLDAPEDHPQRPDIADARCAAAAGALLAMGVPAERAERAVSIAEEEGGAAPDVAHGAVIRLAKAGSLQVIMCGDRPDPEMLRTYIRALLQQGAAGERAAARLEPEVPALTEDQRATLRRGGSVDIDARLVRSSTAQKELTADEQALLRRGGYVEREGKWRHLWAGPERDPANPEDLAELRSDIEAIRGDPSIRFPEPKAPADGLSAEDADTLQDGAWRVLNDGRWVGPVAGGVLDPSTAFGLRILREKAAELRAKEPPAAPGVTGEAPGGDRAAGGKDSVAEAQGEKQGARLVAGVERKPGGYVGRVTWGGFGTQWTGTATGEIDADGYAVVDPDDAAGWGTRRVLLSHVHPLPSAEPTDGPTARDAVAGMLLRCGWSSLAEGFAVEKWSASEVAHGLRASNVQDAHACIAALEALDRGDLFAPGSAVGAHVKAAVDGAAHAVDRVALDRDVARSAAAALQGEAERLTRQLDAARAEAAALREELANHRERIDEMTRNRDAMREELDAARVDMRRANDISPLRPAEDIARETVKSGVAELELVIEDGQETAIVMCRKNYRTGTYEKTVRVIARLIERSRAEGKHACAPAAIPKPPRVEAGQRWAFDGRKVALDLRPATVVHVDAKWADASGPHGQWTAHPSDMLSDPRWTFLGTTPQGPKPWRGIQHEAGPHRTDLDTWVVEAVDEASEGEIYAAHFSGQHAEARAREYAAWVSAPASPNGVACGEGEPIEALPNPQNIAAAFKSIGEAPSGMRIEKREDGEWLVSYGDVNECNERMLPDDANTLCCFHLDGYHIGVGRSDGRGARIIIARWPIAPAQDEPAVVGVDMGTGPAKVAAVVLRREPSGEVKPLATFEGDDAEQKAREYIAGLPGEDAICMTGTTSHPEALTSADGNVTVIVRGGVESRAVLATVAELLGLANDSLRSMFERNAYRQGVENGERRAEEKARATARELVTKWCRRIDRHEEQADADAGRGYPEGEHRYRGRAGAVGVCIHDLRKAFNLPAADRPPTGGEPAPDASEVVADRATTDHVAPAAAAAADERWQPGAVWEHRAGGARRLDLRQVDEVRGVAFLCVAGTWGAMQSIPRVDMTPENGWRYVGPSSATAGAPGGNSMEADGARCGTPLGAQPESPNVPSSCQVIPSGAQDSAAARCSEPGMERVAIEDRIADLMARENGPPRRFRLVKSLLTAEEARRIEAKGWTAGVVWYHEDPCGSWHESDSDDLAHLRAEAAPVVPGEATAEERDAMQQPEVKRWWTPAERQRLVESITRVIIDATAKRGMVVGQLAELIVGSLVYVHRLTPPAKSTAAHAEAMAIERAHADGIVEGLTRAARELRHQMSVNGECTADALHRALSRIEADATTVDPADRHVERSALLELATGWETLANSTRAETPDCPDGGAPEVGKARGLDIAAGDLRRLLNAPRGPGGGERQLSLSDVERRLRARGFQAAADDVRRWPSERVSEAEGQRLGRERAQDLAERWRRRASNPAAPSPVTAALEVCAFELCEEFGLDPEGAEHEPGPSVKGVRPIPPVASTAPRSGWWAMAPRRRDLLVGWIGQTVPDGGGASRLAAFAALRGDDAWWRSMPERARAAYVAWLEAQRPVVDGEALSPGLVGAACDLLRGAARAAVKPSPNAAPSALGDAVAMHNLLATDPAARAHLGGGSAPEASLAALGADVVVAQLAAAAQSLAVATGGDAERIASEARRVMAEPAAHDIEPVRAALRAEADAFAAIETDCGMTGDGHAARDASYLRRAADVVESAQQARLVLTVLGFGVGSIDRVLGTSPSAAQDGSSVAQAGPRIEVRDGEEWLAGEWSRACCLAYGPGRYVCSTHLDDQHVALGPWHDGASLVYARWPITPPRRREMDPRLTMSRAALADRPHES